MNESSSPHLIVETTRLSDEDVKAVRESYFREARSSVLLTFLLVAILAGGVPAIVFIFWRFKYDYVVVFSIGSMAGLLVTGWLLATVFREYRVVRADLLSGHCEVLRVSAVGALNVRLNDNLPAIAFDCGYYTLVLSGNWQNNIYRRTIWGKSRDRVRFPNSNFVLRRLSGSGRILRIEVSGSKLPLEENDPNEPSLDAQVPAYVESFYVDRKSADVFKKVNRPSPTLE